MNHQKIITPFVLLLAFPLLVTASEINGVISTEVDESGVGGVVVATPIFSPIGATYTSSRNVTISASGASRVYYTNNGNNPSCGTGVGYSGASGAQYSGSISVSSSQTLKSIACYQNGGTIYSSAITTAAYVINVSSGGGGGGGGGGGSSSRSSNSSNSSTPTTPTTPAVVTNNSSNSNSDLINRIIAEIRSRVQTMVQNGESVSPVVQSFLNAFGGVSGPNYSSSSGVRDLEYGMEGEDVRSLQRLLLAQGYSIPSGATGRFLIETQLALTAYQKDYGISPAVGYFGPATRAQMKTAALSGLWW